MKKFSLITCILVSLIHLYSGEIEAKIRRYAGSNAENLIDYYHKMNYEQKYALFLLNHCSANDLAVLTPSFLQNQIEYAMTAAELDYCEYDDTIFKHFVLPYRISQEPLENWRETFYETLLPLVETAETIEEAAILVNLWVTEQMTFLQTHGRDQSPLTTIKRGFGRCEESMILFIAAARAVGIPARPASVPFWNFTDNNHAWVEIWTPTGWKYLGEAENALNRAWFSNTTKRATLITAKAFGNYQNPHTIKQKDHVTTLSSIEYYTTAKKCSIFVQDSFHQTVANASVHIYAVSYGGLFPMIELFTDKNGMIEIPLGEGTVFLTAYHENLFASGILQTLAEENPSLTLTLGDSINLQENLTFLFPLPTTKKSVDESEEILGEKFYLLRENAHLKRKERLAKMKKTKNFVPFYDQVYWYKIEAKKFDEQHEYLEKCDELAANTDIFLQTLQKNSLAYQKIIIDMILEWDIKELIEIPDSTALQEIVDIYRFGKQKNLKVVSDSLFRKHVIHRTWRSSIPPENGWQKSLFEQIQHLSANDLTKTVQNTIRWVDEKVILDSEFVYTYFSGALNPLELINMKHIPEFYRTVLINSILKQLGVPVQWKGRLEFYNGTEFIPVEPVKQKEKQTTKQNLKISLFIDGKQKKAEPWNNFLLAKLAKNGSIQYTYFDGENDSLSYNASFLRTKDDVFYLEAAHRNTNGDANVRIQTINPQDEEISVQLQTPKEFVDLSTEWSQKTIRELKKYALNHKNTVVFVFGLETNEPEKRIYNQFQEKLPDFEEKNIAFTYLALRKDNLDFINSKVIIDFDSESIDTNQYPLIFVFDPNKNLIFSSKGYHMGLSQLILQKCE